MARSVQRATGCTAEIMSLSKGGGARGWNDRTRISGRSSVWGLHPAPEPIVIRAMNDL